MSVHIDRNYRRPLFFSSLLIIAASSASHAQTSDAGSNDPADAVDSNELVVTARRREERLQDVPDSVTLLSTATIERAGLRTLDDFTRMVPNLTFRNGKGFNGGDIRLSMRGVGNGQQGWPSVAFLVDSVPVDSLDNLAGGNYTGIARVEVLRGPQSAVYGANAIAGAVNVITKQPDGTFGGQMLAEYANGNDKRMTGDLTGPIAGDVLAFRLNAEIQDADGSVKNATDGRGLNFINAQRLRGQLLFRPIDRLTFDLKGEYNHSRNGAMYHSLVPSRAFLDKSEGGFGPRRRLIGEENRKYHRVSLRATYAADTFELTSVTSYSNSRQTTVGSLCYNDPDNPLDTDPAPGAQAGCYLGGTALGSSAATGELVDQVFEGGDSSRSFFQDARLQSSGGGPFQWMFGATYMSRRAVNGFNTYNLLGGANGGDGCGDKVGFDFAGCQVIPVFPRWDRRQDNWWGAYAQLSYEITPQLELTLAGRYDSQKFRNSTYLDRGLAQIVPVPDKGGILVTTLKEKSDDFQPKAQLSYKISSDVMVYTTYAKGYRAGFYNTGSFTLPEKTENYEVGVKASTSTGFGKLMVNGAMFHIDYSNQQSSTVVATPPFRVPITIPATVINGVELETSLTRGGLSLAAAAGYLDAKIKGGLRSPNSPKLTLSVRGDYTHPLGDAADLLLHADWRYSSRQNIDITAPIDVVPPRQYVNLRAGVRWGQFTLTGFVENLTDTREQTSEANQLGTAWLLTLNDPRRYGANIKVDF
ncbi:TonB-dependent receptor [Novosphingobium sp. AP12]|uniref:TonB-dependent receptor n=1 Tax=Novosphingobium sp. AP12 TaxID=1144305 RepID=UPI000272000A|nr:TonB-dependent receptor [Novosphingobium sp. AP12]EJL30842.1 outer membrane receptor protein [Novosphingobium sp. AP12]